MPPALVDVQGFQKSAAQLRLHVIDSAAGGARQADASPRSAIVAAGAAHFADHLAQHLARMDALGRRSHRQDHFIAIHSATDRPVDFLEADEDIDHLRRQFRLRQLIDPADDKAVVDERTCKACNRHSK